MKLPRPTVRVRLTALYALVFGVSVAALLGLSYWLLDRHIGRTVAPGVADDVMGQVGTQYVLAFLGILIAAVAVGWALAGRVLAPLGRISQTARRVSEERLGERIALEGPRDELRELADTLDSMLDRLADSFEAQRRFVANASHELRSPLTIIRSEAEVALANPETDPDELRAMGRAVIEATARTEALLEGLLVLALSQRGTLRREPLDLAALAHSAAASVSDEAKAAQVRVGLDLEEAHTAGDRRLIERLVANLVENGVRHNHAGGTVRLATERRNGSVLVRVSNTGPRISEEAADRLGEPFQRLDRTAPQSGSGLGLSIVHTVNAAHGGSLWLRPRERGGLDVEVAFPAAG